MLIISKYILRSHTAPFLMGTITVLFLFIFQFFLKHIDKLVGKGLDLWVIFQLLTLNIAWMLVLAVPMGVLFSTLMAFGSMSQAHEVTVIKSSGGSLLKMMMPVVFAGMIITIFLFWFNDYVLPDANHRAKSLMQDIRRKKPTFAIESGNFTSELEGYTIMARSVDSLKGTLKGVTIYDTRYGGRQQNIISADTGIVEFSADMSSLILTLYTGEIIQIDPGTVDNFRKVLFDDYKIMIDAGGFEFQRTDEEFTSRGDREMRISDMQKIVNESRSNAAASREKLEKEIKRHYYYLTGEEKYIPSRRELIKKQNLSVQASSEETGADSIQKTGKKEALENTVKRIGFFWSSMSSDAARLKDYAFRAKKYEVEIQKKYAIPFACMVFLFVGCPLGIITRGGNFGLSAAISLGFYIFYWACLIGGEKLADRGLASPFMSMWIGNIIVGLTGIALTLRINNESFRVTFFSRRNTQRDPTPALPKGREQDH